eukprot:RCo029975
MPSLIYSLFEQSLAVGAMPLLGLALFVVPSFIAMGMTGFGPAIIFHVAWVLLVRLFPTLTSSSNEVVDAVMLLAVNAPFSIIPLYLESRADINWDYFWWLLIPKTTCFCLGTEVLVHTPPQLLKNVLGVVFMAFGVWLLGKELNRIGFLGWVQFRFSGVPPVGALARAVAKICPDSGPGTAASGSREFRWRALAVVLGGLSGLLNGMFGVPGPPLLIFFALAPGVGPSGVRATSTACHFWNLPIRLTYFFGFKKRFDPSKLIHMLVVIVFGQVGLRIGSRLHDTVREKAPHTVEFSMLAILFGACTLMIDVPFTVELAVVAAMFLLTVVVHYQYPRWKLFFTAATHRCSDSDRDDAHL